jgi:hypothetical protein
MNTTLNAAGIAPIYLKINSKMIDRMYDDFSEIKIGDHDFLVPEKDYLTPERSFKMMDICC